MVCLSGGEMGEMGQIMLQSPLVEVAGGKTTHILREDQVGEGMAEKP